MAYTATKSRQSHQRKSAANENELVTFDKYYEIVEDNLRADLLDGQIIRDSLAVPKHGRAVAWLIKLVGTYVDELDLGEILCAPTTVRLTKYQAPEPDVFFVDKKRLGIVG